jgi:hypothetical protein
MSSDSKYRTPRFPSTSWYCPSETQERSLAAAFKNLPLPYTIGQVVAFVKAEMSDERPDEYKPAFFEAKVLADRDNLSPEEQRIVRALQASKGKFANPITEIEKGVALSLLLAPLLEGPLREKSMAATLSNDLFKYPARLSFFISTWQPWPAGRVHMHWLWPADAAGRAGMGSTAGQAYARGTGQAIPYPSGHHI